ncbi:low molecular weight protein tyrosine phosphatase family protein [Massilia sp. PWRC2]|uniref:low molecular weight protein tyrosine phosphatase family protein n=1 Tax=Massilia sp. PWRC2 TaxID=2804626 RepID=UPI003CEB5ED4
MKRALFICTQNRLRSPTAERVFAAWPGVDTDSAGLGNDADVPLSREQIEWATVIFVMEKAHRRRLASRFRPYLNGKQVICLDIPDDYTYMQPALIDVLTAKAGRFLRPSI